MLPPNKMFYIQCTVILNRAQKEDLRKSFSGSYLEAKYGGGTKWGRQVSPDRRHATLGKYRQ